MNSPLSAARFHLRLLGGASLEAADGTALGGRVTQRHRLALLALLALAPGRRMTRDKLIALLWPESDAERGRNLLKVSTYVLRSSLGDEVLQSLGDELRLNVEVVACDAAEFEGALERGEPACAVAAYAGPLMDGFFLSNAPEFERWLDVERRRLAGEHARALEALAEEAEEARDFAVAIAWWKRRAAADPYDSRVALRLMRALACGGNRAAALQHAALHRRLLREEFEIEPPAEVQALAERLREEAAVDRASAADARVPSPPPPAEEPPRAAEARAVAAAEAHAPAEPAAASVASTPAGRAGWWRRPLAAVAAGLVIVASAATAAIGTDARPEPSVVVLPFVDLSPDGDTLHFGDGLTEEVIAQLSAISELKVISRTSAMHYKGSDKPLGRIADELQVAHVLTGSVRRNGGRVRITAQLVDARNDRPLWSEHYEHDLRDVLRVQEVIARSVVRALELRLGERVDTLPQRPGTRDPEAHHYYRRGRYLWNTRTPEGHAQAISYFRKAIERDPRYADAWAGLADTYLTAYQLNLHDRLGLSVSETYARLRHAAERALALDERSADAHVSFAVLLWWQRDWRGAERELRRAIALNPGHATARTWYGLLLAGQGRAAEGMRESRRAYDVDPFAVVASNNVAWHCYLARDYDCALDQLRRTIEIGPTWGNGFVALGRVYAAKGMYAEARAAIERGIALRPERSEYLGELAYVTALGGNAEEARRILARAKADPVEPFTIGRAHVALGEPDSAFAWLARANWRWPHRAVRADPALDPIRGDPRFVRLSERIDREMGIR